MTKEQYIAAASTIYDLEEMKRNAAMRAKMARWQYADELKQAKRDYEDACELKNRVCDMLGIRRMEPSFNSISDDIDVPLDVVYAVKSGETYNDGLSNSILGRAISGMAKAAGASRVILDNYRRI
jgi:hypothetical protein